MTIGTVLDRAVYFYRTHFFPLLAWVALFVVPLSFISAVIAWVNQQSMMASLEAATVDPSNFDFASYFITVGGTMVGSILLSLVSYLFLPLQVAGVGVALRGFLLEGRQVSIGEIAREIRPRLVPLLVTGFLGMIFSLLLSSTLIIPPVGLAILTLYYTAFSLAPFIVLYEGEQGLAALRRGWIVMRGNLWRILGAMLVIGLLTFIGAGAIGGAIGILGESVALFTEQPLLSYIIQMTISSLVSVVVTPLTYAVTGLLYFDSRVRFEGLDLALAAAEGAGERAELASAPRGDEPVLNQATWKSLAILSGIYSLLFIFLCGCIFALGAAFSSIMPQL